MAEARWPQRPSTSAAGRRGRPGGSLHLAPTAGFPSPPVPAVGTCTGRGRRVQASSTTTSLSAASCELQV